MKVKRHYHVLSGMHGYMPDSNFPTRTLREARAVAIEEVRICRAAGDRYVGSARGRYYECVSVNEYGTPLHGGPEYIEITDCYEEDCLDELNVE